MRLNITGKARKCDVQEMRDALHFYADKLLRPSTKKKLKISVRITNDLPRDTFADCIWNGDDPVRPKSFTLRVWGRGAKKNRMIAMAHEMVHVKQQMTGELRDLISTTDTVLWNGIRHRLNEDDEDYWLTPWEVEAYGKEYGLYYLWRKDVRRRARLKKRKKK